MFSLVKGFIGDPSYETMTPKGLRFKVFKNKRQWDIYHSTPYGDVFLTNCKTKKDTKAVIGQISIYTHKDVRVQ
jgi:hypothetical protein